MTAGKLSCVLKTLKFTQYSFIHSVSEDFICVRHLGGGCGLLFV